MQMYDVRESERCRGITYATCYKPMQDTNARLQNSLGC